MPTLRIMERNLTKQGLRLISLRKNIVELVSVEESEPSDKDQEVKENKAEAEDIDEDESAISVRDPRAKKVCYWKLITLMKPLNNV